MLMSTHCCSTSTTTLKVFRHYVVKHSESMARKSCHAVQTIRPQCEDRSCMMFNFYHHTVQSCPDIALTYTNLVCRERSAMLSRNSRHGFTSWHVLILLVRLPGEHPVSSLERDWHRTAVTSMIRQ
jgi:hypothetical protein